MLKKFMTGLIALALMAGTIGTITSFADYEKETSKEELAEDKDARINEYRESKINETLSKMHPEIIGINAQLKTNLDSSKEAVLLIKEQINIIVGIDKEVQKAENIEFWDSINSKIQSNKITTQDATEEIENYKETQTNTNNALLNMSDEEKAKLEELRIQFASFKEESENISKELSEAVNSEEAAAFKVAFDNIITILGTTNSLDKRKVELLTDIFGNLV